MNLASTGLSVFISQEQTMAVIAAIIGLSVVGFGLLSDKFYYARGYTSSNSVAPTWLGRTLFIGIGVLFIIVSVHYLLFEQ